MSAATFQDAKDTFYLALRDRLVLLNGDRTVVVRDAARIAVVVAENEIAEEGAEWTGAFVLRWTESSEDPSGPMPLLRGRCEIHYTTAGMPEVAGMDRGRTLAAMDEELLGILQPAQVPLQSYAGAGAPVTGGTAIFWSDVSFGAARTEADRMARTAVVDVFAWKEQL